MVPFHPGLLCTVEVVAAAGQGGHIKKTVSVEFGAYSIPPLRAAIQTAGIGASPPSTSSSSMLVHWGALKAGGNVRLISQKDVPEKTSQASVSGQPYGEMSHPQDRWFDMWVGGDVIFDRPQSSGVQTLPENLHVGQNPVPGLKMDQWQYEALKRMAIQFGSYYGLDRDGRLHPGGVIHPGEGVAADEVLSARGVGDHHGLVFIDTLDQQPPRIDNLGTLTLDSDYLEGMFVMNAHVIWNPTSSTKFLPALSPPPEKQQSMGLRIPVQLSGINLRGVLYTAGNLVYCGRPRVFGGIMTEGMLSSCGDQHALLEVWYDHDLMEGLHRGIPVVYVAPGTWPYMMAASSTGQNCRPSRSQEVRTEQQYPPIDAIAPLVSQGFMQKEELKLAIADSLRNGVEVERILIDRFRVPKAVLGTMLGNYYGCSYRTYDGRTVIDPDLLKNLSLDYLRGNHWVPLQRRGKVIDVVIDDPRNVEKRLDVHRAFPSATIQYMVGLRQDIEQFLSAGSGQSIGDAITDILGELVSEAQWEEQQNANIAQITENDSAIVRLANKIIAEAYRLGASDIHIEPYADRKETAVRFRVDGTCFTYMKIPAA